MATRDINRIPGGISYFDGKEPPHIVTVPTLKQIAEAIKCKVGDLNDALVAAAAVGLSTEFLIDKHDEGEADYQTLRVVTSERL